MQRAMEKGDRRKAANDGEQDVLWKRDARSEHMEKGPQDCKCKFPGNQSHKQKDLKFMGGIKEARGHMVDRQKDRTEVQRNMIEGKGGG